MQSPGSPFLRVMARSFLIGFSAAILLFTSACSTVKVKAVRGSVTKEGIASAEQLRALPLMEAPSVSLASVGEVTASELRRAVAHGTVVASYTVQGFSLDALKQVERPELDGRYKRLLELVRIP